MRIKERISALMYKAYLLGKGDGTLKDFEELLIKECLEVKE